MNNQTTIKDYLGTENARNKANAALFTALLQAAFGPDIDVLVGHHITFERHGQIDSENEVPSADTLIFDHAIMFKVFGERALSIMLRAAAKPCEQREELVAGEYAALVESRGQTATV